MNKEHVVFFVCITLIFLSSVFSISFYFINKNTLMYNNIESAIQKGINPISVRCSYADSKDLICAVHASSQQSNKNTLVELTKNKK